jgi:hypothetical protein
MVVETSRGGAVLRGAGRQLSPERQHDVVYHVSLA